MGCQCEMQRSNLFQDEFKLKNDIKSPINSKAHMENDANDNIHSDWSLRFSSKRELENGNPHNYSTEYESYNGRDLFDAHRLLNQINKVREKPTSVKDKISKYQSMIVQKDGRYRLEVSNQTFINLSGGYDAFASALKLIDKQKPLPPYKILNELMLPFPHLNPSLAMDQRYLQLVIFDKAKELKDCYDIVGFHYDQMINDPELAVVLQVIDDTNSGFMRRKNLFSQEAEYIGISGGRVSSSMYCFYYLFAKQRNKTFKVKV